MAMRLERNRVPPPKTTMDVVSILVEAITKFCLTETQHVFNLPAAIVHAVLDKDKKTVARECSERDDCVELKDKDPEELREVEKLLTWTTNIKSKRRFLGFLKDARIENQVHVLKWKRAARILKPAYRVISDTKSKCLIVFIRGTHSVKDTLTDALCAPVAFEHLIYSDNDSKRRNKVSGHVHRGMVAAADWVRKGCISILHDALRQHPHYKIKIVGHSLGGGTAALLTYMLREIQQFSSTTCVTFGPAACMTMGLAEFGKPFITSIINGSDIVPTLSASSVHDFLSQGQIINKNILTTFGSFLPKFAKDMTKYAITRCTDVVSSLVEDNDEYNSSSDDDDSDDNDDDDNNDYDNNNEKLLNENVYANGKEDKNITKGQISSRRYLYPPGRVMHIIPTYSLENFNPHINYDVVEKRVLLYDDTPRNLYEKLRFSRRMILDHPTKKYLKMLQQVIYQLEKEQVKYHGG